MESRLTQKDKRRVQLAQTGMSVEEIAKREGVSTFAIYRWIKAMHNIHGAKLKFTDVLKEREMLYIKGVRQVDIADIQRIDSSAISAWIKRNDEKLMLNKRKEETLRRRLEMLDEGYTLPEMGREEGTDVNIIRDWYKTLPFMGVKNDVYSRRVRAERHGYTRHEIAGSEGIRVGLVNIWFERYKELYKKTKHMSKIQKVRKELYLSGVSGADIARIEGITESAVSKWISRGGLEKNYGD